MPVSKLGFMALNVTRKVWRSITSAEEIENVVVFRRAPSRTLDPDQRAGRSAGGLFYAPTGACR